MTEPSWYNVDPGESDASINSTKISEIKSRTYESDNPKKFQYLRSQKVPSSTIPKGSNLKTYDAKRFQPIYVYKDLERYYHEGELNLSGKHLSRSNISSLAYSFQHKLKKLDVSGCGLTDAGLNGLKDCHRLEELNLSNNPLCHFRFRGWWEHLSSLKKLDLSGCSLTAGADLYGLNNCLKLEELNLSNNPLHHFRSRVFLRYPFSLKKLDLSGCGLTADADLDGFENCHRLEELNLSNNPLRHFRFRGYWEHLSSVKKLDLSGCGMTDTDLDGLKNFHGLKELNLSNNRLNDFGFLAGYWDFLGRDQVSLRSLNLSGCCLTRWPSGLEKYISLQELNLSNNFFGHQDLLENLNNGKMLSQSGLHESEKELLEPPPSVLGLPNLSRIIFEDAVYTKNDGG